MVERKRDSIFLLGPKRYEVNRIFCARLVLHWHGVIGIAIDAFFMLTPMIALDQAIA